MEGGGHRCQEKGVRENILDKRNSIYKYLEERESMKLEGNRKLIWVERKVKSQM